MARFIVLSKGVIFLSNVETTVVLAIYKAWIFANNTKNEEALHFAERSLEIDPNNAAALDTKGFIFYNLNQYEKALEYYDKALYIEPNYAEALNHKGSVLDKLGRRDEAQNCFDKAKELELKNNL